ncbi:hypothetical protein WH96_06360 [Kiloniella spongiae]|uniref:Uncharacterized protein n=1 Tax=Kiloniella spongiae TaxID=1489064 RepID=A0A0H2MYX5_9PROT|nr:hypothetical protein [Kiloniella spongiae]KLN61895.1 hypothetical protein WH96_06360 [Kiloniella spongiae]
MFITAVQSRFKEIEFKRVLKAFIISILVLFLLTFTYEFIDKIYYDFTSIDGANPQKTNMLLERALELIIKFSLYLILYQIPSNLPVLLGGLVLNFCKVKRIIWTYLLFIICFISYDVYNLFDFMYPREGTSTFGYSTRDCVAIVDNVRTACGYEIWAKGFFRDLVEALIGAAVYLRFYQRGNKENVRQMAVK